MTEKIVQATGYVQVEGDPSPWVPVQIQGGQVPAPLAQAAPPSRAEMVGAVVERVATIHEIASRVMKEGTHYGTIPGCGPKKVLLKPGAEILLATFQFVPTYQIEQTNLDGGHREYRVTATLSTPAGVVVGQGVGCHSTMESRYRYRQAQRICPHCGNATIRKGLADYGGGWVCWTKKGGCGAKFKDGDKAIEGQALGQVENTDLADFYNTVLKMSKKSALVDAVLSTTAASDLWTQDLEDQADGVVGGEGEAQPEAPPAAQKAPRPSKPTPKAPPAAPKGPTPGAGQRPNPVPGAADRSSYQEAYRLEPDPKMTIGKHNGKRLSEIPTSYLKWYMNALVESRAKGETPPDQMAATAAWITAVGLELETRKEGEAAPKPQAPPPPRPSQPAMPSEPTGEQDDLPW